MLAKWPDLIYIPRGTRSQPRGVCIPTGQEGSQY